MDCSICDRQLGFSWTDTHGVAQCTTCGTPYRIFHYEDDKRVDKPPEIRVLVEYVPVLRAYWNEARRRMPGGHSFQGGQELATNDDVRAFNEWMSANAERLLSENAAPRGSQS